MTARASHVALAVALLCGSMLAASLLTPGVPSASSAPSSAGSTADRAGASAATRQLRRSKALTAARAKAKAVAASKAEVVGYDAYWCERRSRRSYSCTIEVDLRPIDRPEPDDALKCTWKARVAAARSGRPRVSVSTRTLYCRWASQLYGFKGPACVSRCG